MSSLFTNISSSEVQKLENKCLKRKWRVVYVVQVESYSDVFHKSKV